jgi:hypothetical protein
LIAPRRRAYRAQIPMPARQLGSVAGHAGHPAPHRSEHRLPPLASSTHSALAQSASPAHTAPGTPVPRGPGTHDTIVPVGSWLTQAVAAGQSWLEKHGQSPTCAHARVSASTVDPSAA